MIASQTQRRLFIELTSFGHYHFLNQGNRKDVFHEWRIRKLLDCIVLLLLFFTNVAVVLMNNEWILVLYLQKIWSGFMQSLFDALNF